MRAYGKERGGYPNELDQLVPVYLPAVPRAKPTPGFGRFEYLARDDDAWLHCTSVPPFGRSTYRFAAARWGHLDRGLGGRRGGGAAGEQGRRSIKKG